MSRKTINNYIVLGKFNMAEKFTSFLSSITTTNPQEIIPVSGGANFINGSNESMGSNSRDADTILLVNSINLTGIAKKAANIGNQNWNIRVSVYISYQVNNIEQKIYLYNRLPLVQGASFYLEKNITLLPTQKLMVVVDSMADSSDYEVNVLASAVSLEA